MTTLTGKKFASFQGIRYAQPPVGELRFRSPKPYMDAAGATVNVSGVSTVQCPQYNGYNEEGQEDCLMLNVYVPESAFDDVDELMSVMVWVHGGSLVKGTNSMQVGFKYSPFTLVDNDVILVSINYRLSYLGFMFMGTEDVPGNAGLRDQNMAMTWVQDHIDMFGGNPGAVTIFGESAGSISVSYHLASPLSRGLFQRAIMESGTTVSPNSSPVTPDTGLRSHKIVAESLNCTGDNDDDVLQCMQSKSAWDVVNHNNFLSADGGMPYPVIDGSLGLMIHFYPPAQMRSSAVETSTRILRS